MSDIQQRSQAARDPVEDLVFLYLEEREEGLVRGFEDFARRHPSSSAAVKERIDALERAGLMDDEAQPSFPERLGNFRLIERLGGGGMGIVFLAEEESLGRRVALKLIRPEQIYFPQAKERFRREVEAVAKLSHPGIVQVFSFAEDGGVPFFAMELVEGASLGQVLTHFAGREPASLSGRELKSAVETISGKQGTNAAVFEGSWTRACLEIARQVALALGHAHERGVVHRDIKPSNVMITLDGRARLLDFGLASRSGASRLTRTGAQLGSLPYMSPELVGGQVVEAGPATDVYSLGVALHEALALKLPFGGESSAEVARRIAAGEHEALRQRNPEVSTDAETICNVAMELDPERRYASAGAMAVDLASVLERRPIAARRTGRLVRTKRWVQRNPAGAAAGALAALLLVGGPMGYGLLQARAASKEHDLNEELKSANSTVRLTNTELEAAKSALEAKNESLSAALVREQNESARAERNFAHAIEAVQEMLTNVGSDDLRQIPRFEAVRKQLLERALSFYARLEHDDPTNVAVQREIARSSRAMADLLDDLGRPEESIAKYTQAVLMSRAVLERDPDSLNTRHMYSSSLVQLARKQHLAGNVEAARAAYEEALPISEMLAEKLPANMRYAHDVAAICLNLGGLELAAGRNAAALEHRRRAVEVMRPALVLNPGDQQMLCQFLKCLNGLAICEQDAGLFEEARAHLGEAWSLARESLAQNPEYRELRTDLLQAAVNYGLLLSAIDPQEAQRVLEYGMESGRRLAADFPEDLHARHNFASVGTNLGYVLTNASRWDEALQSLNEAVSQCEHVASKDASRLEFQCSLATALGCRSTALLGLARIDEAHADAVRAVSLYEKVRRSLPRHPMVLAGTASCVMQRAEVECKIGDWPSALASTDEAISLGAKRSDIAFQAFEAYWHIAQVAAADHGLVGEERKTTLDEVVGKALAQLDSTIQQGFQDFKRLKTHPDYEGLRSDPRFRDMVEGR